MYHKRVYTPLETKITMDELNRLLTEYIARYGAPPEDKVKFTLWLGNEYRAYSFFVGTEVHQDLHDVMLMIYLALAVAEDVIKSPVH